MIYSRYAYEFIELCSHTQPDQMRIVIDFKVDDQALSLPRKFNLN